MMKYKSGLDIEGNVTIQTATAGGLLTLKDTDGTTTTAIPIMQFNYSSGRLGYVGYGSNANTSLYVTNDIGGIILRAVTDTATITSGKVSVSGDLDITSELGVGVTIANKRTTYGGEFRVSGGSAQIFFGRDGSSIGSGAIGADATDAFALFNGTTLSKMFQINQNGNITASASVMTMNSTDNTQILLKVGGVTRAAIGDLGAGTDGQLALYDSSGVIKTVLSADAGQNSYMLGNLGIGTDTPAAKLDVALGAEGEYLRIGGDDASNGRALRFTSSTTNGTVGALHTINAPSINGVIALATNSLERFRITSSGNIGVGKTDPIYPLDVNGIIRSNSSSPQVRIHSTANQNGYLIFGDLEDDDVGQIYYTHSDNRMRFKANATDVGFLNNTGFQVYDNKSIRLGDSSDAQFFHNGTNTYLDNITGGMLIRNLAAAQSISIAVDNNAGTNQTVIVANGTGADTYAELRHGGNYKLRTSSSGIDVNGTITASGYNPSNWDTAYTYSQIGHLPLSGGTLTGTLTINAASGTPTYITSTSKAYSYISLSNTSSTFGVSIGSEVDDMAFQTGASERMRITSGGNVCIGTTSPSEKLHVSLGNVRLDNGYMVNFSDTNWAIGRNIVTTTGSLLTSNKVQVKVYNGSTQGFQIVNSSSQALFEVDGNNGKVYIGGLNTARGGTATKFFVKMRTSQTYAELQAETTATNVGLLFSDGASGNYGLINYLSTDHMLFYTASGERMRITNTGNVGIKTTNPSHELHVVGNVEIDNDGVAPTASYSATPDRIIGGNVDGNALGTPDVWLRIYVNGTAYVFPGYAEP